jgi:hypothetical protein
LRRVDIENLRKEMPARPWASCLDN